MPEGENLLSPEEAARMGRTADSLGSADDDTAGTPEHNMSADALEERAAAHQGEDLPSPATDGGMPGFEAVPSDPVVAAQGLGGVAAEGVTKIPVSYEDTIKGPIGDHDPLTQQWREQNWIHDPGKAEAMAHAGDELRTEAAVERQAANAASTYRLEFDRIASNNELETEGGRILTEQGHQEINDLDKNVEEKLAKSHELDDIGTQDLAWSRVQAGNRIEGARAHAEAADKKAEIVEEAASLQHDVEEEAKKPEYRFGISDELLAKLEAHARQLQQLIEDIRDSRES